MKAKIVAKVDLDVETLPYHIQLLDFLVEEKKRTIPGPDHRYQSKVCPTGSTVSGIFSEVIASDNTSNNAGAQNMMR